MAPAMHTEMWDHPATQANVVTLTERGVHVIPPASGRLTGADTGPGRLPEPEELYAVCERILAHHRSGGARSPASAAYRSTPRSGSPWRGVVSSSRPEARVSHWTRCATSGTAARASRATPSRPSRPDAAPT